MPTIESHRERLCRDVLAQLGSEPLLSVAMDGAEVTFEHLRELGRDLQGSLDRRPIVRISVLY